MTRIGGGGGCRIEEPEDTSVPVDTQTGSSTPKAKGFDGDETNGAYDIGSIEDFRGESWPKGEPQGEDSIFVSALA